MSDTVTIRRVLFVAGAGGAMLRYRVRHVEEALRDRSIRTATVTYRDPRVEELALRADVVVLYRVPMTRDVDRVVQRLRRARPATPLLFDIDDLVFDTDLAMSAPVLRTMPAEDRRLWLDGVRRYRQTLEVCDAATVSTRVLADHVRALGIPAEILPNGPGAAYLHLAAAAPERPPAGTGDIRLGYFSGSPTHDEDWALIEPAVTELMGTRAQVRLTVVGPVTMLPGLADWGDRVRTLPFVRWTRLPALVRDVDVMLAPLVPGPFNEGKSALKWIESAPLRVPCIASPRAGYVDALTPGVDGVLADDEPGAWVSALEQLVDDAELRRSVGVAADRTVRDELGADTRARRWIGAVRSVEPRPLGSGHDAARPGELVDEPTLRRLPEPYPWGGTSSRWRFAVDDARWRWSVLTSYVVSAGRRWRSGGPAAVASGVSTVIARQRAERAAPRGREEERR